MPTRIHTQDAAVQMSGLSAVQRSLRLILADRLTETQNRRINLLFGLDGERPLGVRATARVEGVDKRQVQKARDGALQRLVNDWRLWAYWLLWGEWDPDSHTSRADDAAPSNWDLVNGDGAVSPEEMAEMPAIVEGYGCESWATDAASGGRTSGHVPAATPEQEAYADGWLAFGEGVEDNPYENDGLNAAWQLGWQEASNSVS